MAKGLGSGAKKALIITGSVIGAILLTGVIVYAADAGMHATVTDKGYDTSKGQNWIELKITTLLGLHYKAYLDGSGGFAAVTMVNKGNHFAYHVRSGDVDIWTTEASWKNGNPPDKTQSTK